MRTQVITFNVLSCTTAVFFLFFSARKNGFEAGHTVV